MSWCHTCKTQLWIPLAASERCHHGLWVPHGVNHTHGKLECGRAGGRVSEFCIYKYSNNSVANKRMFRLFFVVKRQQDNSW